MSNGRPFRKVHRLLDDLHEQTEDEPVPGGCDRCDAYQTVDQVDTGLYTLTIHHDDWCPSFRARRAGAN